MPSRRANARIANARNANAAPPVQDQEVSKVELKNAIQMLVQSMTNQNNEFHVHVKENGGSILAKVCDFVRMNFPEFLGSQSN